LVLVGVEFPSQLGPRKLDRRDMNNVSPDQQSLAGARYFKYSVADLMANRLDRGDRGTQPVTVDQRQTTLAEPGQPLLPVEKSKLRLRDEQPVEVREGVRTVGRDEPVDVVLMRVGESDRSDIVMRSFQTDVRFQFRIYVPLQGFCGPANELLASAAAASSRRMTRRQSGYTARLPHCEALEFGPAGNDVCRRQLTGSAARPA
jgi:hypothetical protein